MFAKGFYSKVNDKGSTDKKVYIANLRGRGFPRPWAAKRHPCAEIKQIERYLLVS